MTWVNGSAVLVGLFFWGLSSGVWLFLLVFSVLVLSQNLGTGAVFLPLSLVFEGLVFVGRFAFFLSVPVCFFVLASAFNKVLLFKKNFNPPLFLMKQCNLK